MTYRNRRRSELSTSDPPAADTRMLSPAVVGSAAARGAGRILDAPHLLITDVRTTVDASAHVRAWPRETHTTPDAAAHRVTLEQGWTQARAAIPEPTQSPLPRAPGGAKK